MSRGGKPTSVLREPPRCPICGRSDSRLVEHLSTHDKLELAEVIARVVIPPLLIKVETEDVVPVAITDDGLEVLATAEVVPLHRPAQGRQLSDKQRRQIHRMLGAGTPAGKIEETLKISKYTRIYHRDEQCTCAKRGVI